MSEFAKKTIIVTGGTRGIGHGIASAFLQEGARVYVCGRSQPDTLPEWNGRSAGFIQADVRKEEQIQLVIDRTLAETGRLDILINNAGGSPEADAATASTGFSEAIIRLNLIAPLIFSQKACEAMRKTGGCGSIINIASVSGVRPSPGTAAYGAAKAGLINLTQSLAQEWGPDIRVNSIIAGLMQTEAADDHYEGSSGLQKIAAVLPLKRLGRPEDIAAACLFLSSDAAAYISGASLEVTGGGEPPVHRVLAEQTRNGKDTSQ
ncbi:SDR family oxidoreductase [Emcibacter sp.]|uniref:SDR family oxidoreductase n=1 Tax=Emcibacter sp. TaxID=1979954 RepID=UPI002AA5E54B|nr:SDR family oxidoreductase [Emcibacter sp.]